VRAAELSDLSGCEAYLKLETLQTTGSFKERGALNKLLTLGKAERKAGVVAMSAGNHAQGVAYHARRLGIPATIVMPAATPFTKIDRTEALGARVVLRGESLVEAREAADRLARETGLVPVHPYDDPAVIAGQGTVALEMLADEPGLEILLVPVGGGGLISGVAGRARTLPRPQGRHRVDRRQHRCAAVGVAADAGPRAQRAARAAPLGIARYPGRAVAGCRRHRRSRRQHRRGASPAPVPRHIREARRTRRRRRNAKPASCRHDHRCACRSGLSDAPAVGQRGRAGGYPNRLCILTGATSTRSTRRPSISTISKRQSPAVTRSATIGPRLRSAIR